MLCFRRMSDNILKWMKAIDPNKDDVIEAAAKLIKDDIRNMSCSNHVHPNKYDILREEEGNEWVPDSLQKFMSYLVPHNSRIKRLRINQCIVQASRPRSMIAPIPFGLGVALEQNFGSRWLLNLFSWHGFCSSAE